MEFLFGDMVIDNESNVGVVVKPWFDMISFNKTYWVYVEKYDKIKEYKENEIEHYKK